MIQSGIQPLQNVGVLQALPFGPEEKITWAREWIVKGLKGEPHNRTLLVL